MQRQSRTRGFLAADAIIGLAVVMILTATLAAAVWRHQRGVQRLADARAAVRLAEAALLALQTGQSLPPAPNGATLRVRKLDAPADTPAGLAWANVTATVNGRSSDLAALVRADALKGATP